MSAQEVPNFDVPEYPEHHMPTDVPTKRPLRLAEMPDEWFDHTPQVAGPAAVLETGVKSSDQEAWLGLDGTRTQAADRRRFRREDEVREPAHLRAVSKPASKAVLDAAGGRANISRYDDADIAQEKFDQAIVETLRTLPYAKGAKTRPTPEEERAALSAMRTKKRSGR